jgi:hypothetical protein
MINFSLKEYIYIYTHVKEMFNRIPFLVNIIDTIDWIR